MIELRDVSKIYGEGESGFQALKHFSYKIQDGGVVMIVGPSGSGKTTLLNIIGCMDTPTDGDVIHDGVSVLSLSEDERAKFRNEKIGFVFQNYQLLPALNVYENIAMPFLVAKKKVDEQRIATLLDRLGLSEKSTVLPSKLSGGQKQRVAIARAMALQPKYLLADEPTGNLDSETGDAVMNLILSIKTSEQTVVLITHNERLSQYSDSIIRMKDGYIENAP